MIEIAGSLACRSDVSHLSAALGVFGPARIAPALGTSDGIRLTPLPPWIGLAITQAHLRFATGSFIIQVSSETTARRAAAQLAWMLSVACERMLVNDDPKTMSPADLAAWMRDVFATALSKRTRMQVVNSMSGRGEAVDDDALRDQATGRA